MLAMDVARTKLSARVFEMLRCLTEADNVAASDLEYEYAKFDGVDFEFWKIPVEIKPDGVIFKDSVVNEDGSIEEVEGSEKLYPSTSSNYINQSRRSRPNPFRSLKAFGLQTKRVFWLQMNTVKQPEKGYLLPEMLYSRSKNCCQKRLNMSKISSRRHG